MMKLYSKTKFVYFLLCFVFYALGIKSQSVGISTASFTPSALLHVKGASNASQFIVQANSTQSNTNPLIKLLSSAGTELIWIHSDNQDNLFMGYQAGKVNSVGGGGIRNTFVGTNAGSTNANGAHNTAFGFEALKTLANTHRNTAMGTYAMTSMSSGTGNVAIGDEALKANADGIGNVAIGMSAYKTGVTGSDNIAVGYEAFANGLVTGQYNIGIGSSALKALTNGPFNIAIGASALDVNQGGAGNLAIGANTLGTNVSGEYNVGLGLASLFSNTGSYNTAVGTSSGYTQGSGDRNTILGYEAGYSNATGDRNIFIGYQSGYSETGSDKLYIDNTSTATPLIYGDFANDFVGINTNAPAYPLHVWRSSSNLVMGIVSDNTTSTSLVLRNTSTGGHLIELFNTGSGNGPGHFGVYSGTANKTVFDLDLTNGHMSMISGAVLGWSANASFAQNASDVSLSRLSAGILGVGTGGAGEYDGQLKAKSAIFYAENQNVEVYNTAGTQYCGTLERAVSDAGLILEAHLAKLYLWTGSSGGDIELETLNTTTKRNITLKPTNNIALFNTSSFGSGEGVIGIKNATTNPSTNPTGGGVLYCDAGALKYRGSSGTTTTLGTAHPHCPVCGADFMHEWQSDKYGYLAVCMKCLVKELGERPYILHAPVKVSDGMPTEENTDCVEKH